ncbi:MAG: metal-dependent hydrolase [Acidobacteria bacterium]|nr:metal-dependent hydrolase [Acidobacteriota bacterium]
MPTPIGHALGGVAAGCLVVAASRFRPGRRQPRELERFLARIGPWRGLAAIACLATIPDLDLLLGIHRGPAHSVGAMLIAAAVAGAWTRSAGPCVAAAAAAAYGSHVLLDWLGADPSAPHGVMALWPWSREFHLSDAHLFLRVCREYWLADCWWHNLRSVARELVILGPIAAAAVLAARCGGAGQPACYGQRNGPRRA